MPLQNTTLPSSRGYGLANALFSSTQQRVLNLIFGQPGRSFFGSEIIAQVGAGSGAVQRELQKLAEAGLVKVSWLGNQKHYQAAPDSPIFSELCALVKKTMGVAEPIRRALAPLQDQISVALIYGSVAKGLDTARSDIDILVVGDTLTLEALFQALAPVEKELGRVIHPTLYTQQELEARLQQGNSFLTKVLGGEVIPLFGEVPNAATRA